MKKKFLGRELWEGEQPPPQTPSSVRRETPPPHTSPLLNVYRTTAGVHLPCGLCLWLARCVELVAGLPERPGSQQR